MKKSYKKYKKICKKIRKKICKKYEEKSEFLGTILHSMKKYTQHTHTMQSGIKYNN